MAEQNIQIKERNGSTWDDLYPRTKGEIVILEDNSTAQDHVDSKVIHVTSSDKSNWNGKATTAYVNQEISKLLASAPSTLNTLNELAEALGDDPNFATTIANAISAKLDKSKVDTNTSLGTSNDKVPSQKAVKTYVDTKVSHAGYGDMNKSTYDSNGNGKADKADFAERAAIVTSATSSPPSNPKQNEVWFATI